MSDSNSDDMQLDGWLSQENKQRLEIAKKATATLIPVAGGIGLMGWLAGTAVGAGAIATTAGTGGLGAAVMGLGLPWVALDRIDAWFACIAVGAAYCYSTVDQIMVSYVDGLFGNVHWHGNHGEFDIVSITQSVLITLFDWACCGGWYGAGVSNCSHLSGEEK